MLPDRVSNPGPLTYESCGLPIALRGPASNVRNVFMRLYGSVEDVVTMCLVYKILQLLCLYLPPPPHTPPPPTHTHTHTIFFLDLDSLSKFTY